MKPTDQEMIAIVPKRREHTVPCWATQGSTRAGQEAEGVGEKLGKRLCCIFCGKKQEKWGKLI